MQHYIRPFQIHNQVSQNNLAVTASNQSITVPAGLGNRSVRIVVEGTVAIYFQLNGVATVAGSTKMLAGTVETFFLPQDTAVIGYIAGGVGSTISVTFGEGT